MKWKTISSAPKDGTWILVTCGKGFVPDVVTWNTERSLWMRDETNESTWIREKDWLLTHWMPLPEPPKENQSWDGKK